MHARIYFTVLMFCLAETAGADIIRCGGQVTEAERLDPLLLSEVLEKCGQPRSREGNVLVYDQPGGMQGVLRFNSAGELEDIDVEVRR